MPHGHIEPNSTTQRVTPEVCTFNSGCIEHRDHVVNTLLGRVCLCGMRLIALTLAARIEHDQSKVMLESIDVSEGVPVGNRAHESGMK